MLLLSSHSATQTWGLILGSCSLVLIQSSSSLEKRSERFKIQFSCGTGRNSLYWVWNEGSFAGRDSDWAGEFLGCKGSGAELVWMEAPPVHCKDLGSPDLSLLNLDHSSFSAVLKMDEKFLKMPLQEADLMWKMSLGRLGVAGVSLDVYEHFLEAWS